MDKKDGLNIHIDKDWNFVIDFRDGNRVRHKVITPDSFCQLFEKNIKLKAVRSGVLPDNCISYCEKEGERFVVLELGQDRMDLIYENTTYENFPLPRLIYGFTVSSMGKITNVYVTVADKGTLRDDTKVYKYPFSNVSGFRMCTGGNVLPEIKKIRQLSSIPNYIFSMPDNNDYYTTDKTRLNMEYRNLLEHLKDKDPDYYYTDVLVPSNKTLQDFLNVNGGENNE